MSLLGFTADGSLYQGDTHYQLRNAYEGLTENRKGEVYPSWVFRGCLNKTASATRQRLVLSQGTIRSVNWEAMLMSWTLSDLRCK